MESGSCQFQGICGLLSSGDLDVHAVNGRQYSSDGTVVLPVTAFGKDTLSPRTLCVLWAWIGGTESNQEL